MKDDMLHGSVLEAEIKNLENQIEAYKATRYNYPNEAKDIIESLEIKLAKRKAELNDEKLHYNTSIPISKSDAKKLSSNPNVVLKQQEISEKEKIHRKNTYKKLKQAYKKGPIEMRLAALFINKPKWRSIKKYSTKEMDYLMKIAYGNTEMQKQWKNKGIGGDKESLWKDFSKALTDKKHLEKLQEIEERHNGR